MTTALPFLLALAAVVTAIAVPNFKAREVPVRVKRPTQRKKRTNGHP